VSVLTAFTLGMRFLEHFLSTTTIQRTDERHSDSAETLRGGTQLSAALWDSHDPSSTACSMSLELFDLLHTPLSQAKSCRTIFRSRNPPDDQLHARSASQTGNFPYLAAIIAVMVSVIWHATRSLLPRATLMYILRVMLVS